MSRAKRPLARPLLATACALAGVALLAGNGVAGLHAALFLVGAAICVLTDLEYRVFIVAGIVGLLTSGVLLAVDAQAAAEKLGDVAFLSLAVGTILSLFGRTGES